MRQDSIELFNKLNLDVDPDEKMGNLTVAKMQMVEIAKLYPMTAVLLSWTSLRPR